MIGAKREYDPESRRRLERHQEIDKSVRAGLPRSRSAAPRTGPQSAGFPSCRPADRSGSHRPSRSGPRRRRASAVLRTGGRAAEPLSRFGHAALQPSIGSRPGRMTTTCHSRLSGSRPASVGQLAAAKRGNESSQGKRGLAGAAVCDDGDQPVPPELVDKLGDLLVAAEEAIRVALRSSTLRPTKGLSRATLFR